MSIIRSKKAKPQSNLLSGIKDTPYPTKGPGVYGKDYLDKFNDYMMGKISANEIIQIKNVLLTKKALESKRQQVPKVRNIRTLTRNPNTILLIKSQLSQLKKDSDHHHSRLHTPEDSLNQELETFVKHYNHNLFTSQSQIKVRTEKSEQSPDNSPHRSARNLSRKENVLLPEVAPDQSPQLALKKFQKIRDIIGQRVHNKKLLQRDEQNKKIFKILQNFQFIAEDYVGKIKNNDLLSSDTSKKFYESDNQSRRYHLKQCQLITKKKEGSNSQSKYIEPETLSPIAKQLFKENSDNYIQSNLKPELPQPLNLTTKNQNLRQKALQQILDRNFNDRLHKYFTMGDQQEQFNIIQSKREKFIKQITQMHSTSPSSQNIPQPLSLHLSTSPRSSKGLLRANRKLTVDAISPKTVAEIQSNDLSLISENEANLDILYNQSRFIQQRVLQKDEKLNRLMRHFIKIEDIKRKAIKTNLRKLGSDVKA